MSLFDLAKAVQWNPSYAKTTNPPWEKRFIQVTTVLGFQNMCPTPEAFAEAVCKWQKLQAGLSPDGMLGPKTWARLEPHTRFSVASSRTPPDWLDGVPAANPTPVMSMPMSGSIPMGVGIASVVRIPVPGMGGLAIEFRPRGFMPQGGSTSTLFIQDITGKRHLRLDYGYNVRTKTIDYHWNQRGTHSNFGIADHTPAGRGGQLGYQAAEKYFRYGGRVLLVAGAALDVYSVVVASMPLRRATEVVSAWAMAWVGCKAVGAGGAAVGSVVTPGPGTAIGGVAGCIIGGVGGYLGGERIGAEVYDWAEGTVFRPLAETTAP